MINRIFGLKQLWLQVNGHAWFHLHGITLSCSEQAGIEKFKLQIYVSSGIRTEGEATPSETALYSLSIMNVLFGVQFYKTARKDGVSRRGALRIPIEPLILHYMLSQNKRYKH